MFFAPYLLKVVISNNDFCVVLEVGQKNLQFSLFRFMFLMMRQSHLIKHFKSRRTFKVLRQLRIPRTISMHADLLFTALQMSLRVWPLRCSLIKVFDFFFLLRAHTYNQNKVELIALKHLSILVAWTVSTAYDIILQITAPAFPPDRIWISKLSSLGLGSCL